MSITVHCACGKSLKARGEDAGKRAKCPHCGAVVIIEEIQVLEEADEPDLPRYQSVTLKVGSVSTRNGYLLISLQVDEEGRGEVQVYATEKNSRRQGVLISFGPGEYADLLALMDKVTQTITHLQKSGQMRKMIER